MLLQQDWSKKNKKEKPASQWLTFSLIKLTGLLQGKRGGGKMS